MNESLESQINRLEKFIADNFPGELQDNECAVDCVIRIISRIASSVTRIANLLGVGEEAEKMAGKVAAQMELRRKSRPL